MHFTFQDTLTYSLEKSLDYTYFFIHPELGVLYLYRSVEGQSDSTYRVRFFFVLPYSLFLLHVMLFVWILMPFLHTV